MIASLFGMAMSLTWMDGIMEVLTFKEYFQNKFYVANTITCGLKNDVNGDLRL